MLWNKNEDGGENEITMKSLKFSNYKSYPHNMRIAYHSNKGSRTFAICFRAQNT